MDGQTSEPVTFRLVVGEDGEVTVQARTAIGDANFVGEGSNLGAAMQSLVGAVERSPAGNVHERHRRPRLDEESHPQPGSFPMFARTFIIDAPNKRPGQGQTTELTDEEANPVHAAIVRILDEAESEVRRKLQAISPTYPTFRLRAR
jgi:hypothetical protein